MRCGRSSLLSLPEDVWSGPRLVGMEPVHGVPGSGAELQKPLALAVSGGLSLSTFITLVVMPVLYSLLERQERVTVGPTQRGA